MCPLGPCALQQSYGLMGTDFRIRQFCGNGDFKGRKTRRGHHFATSTPLTIAIPALLVSFWKRIPFVFEVRDMWPDVPIAIGAIRNPILVWLARWLERMTYRRAAHVVALAPGMREDIIAKGVPAEKITVIPNGCDLDVFASSDRGYSPRTEYAWLGDRKMLIFAGTLGLVNGVDYLVRLAHQVARLDPEIRFVVIGGGREKDAIRSLAGREGVLDRNFFMIEPMPKRELARWLSAADMAVALFTVRVPSGRMLCKTNSSMHLQPASRSPITSMAGNRALQLKRTWVDIEP